MAGASRMSSVLGLKASPHTPKVLPASAPKCFVAFSTSQRFCRSFTRSTARSRSKSRPIWRAIVITARTSLGKHEPPKPTPGKRNGWPMRRSEPIPRRTWSTSAPSRSQSVAISFMKEMRVASIAFAAYFVSSAERRSMKRMGCSARTNGAYSSAMTARARSEATPTTTRSGRMKSSMAAPSFRNSGFETTSKGWAVASRSDLGDPVGAPDRHGALVHDDRVAGERPADLLGGGEDVA